MLCCHETDCYSQIGRNIVHCTTMGNTLSHEDISPAELDALWREPPYTLGGTNEHFSGNDIMTEGEEKDGPVGEPGERSAERDNYWKKKEAFLRGSTVSIGDKFSSEIVLLFTGRRRSSEDPDRNLQEALRTRLRVVESNSKDVVQLFKDLSARLVSVHAEKDSFVLTFKTVEEMWKFSTYLSLGYVARCLENFLCDQSFWLDSELLSDLEINVKVDEEHLATLYLRLLKQEGFFFAKALFSRRDEDGEEDEQLLFNKNDLLLVRDTGQGNMWEGTLLSTGNHGLVPVNAMQPMPYPFYQWFLRKYPGHAEWSPLEKEQFEHPIVTGSCVAVVDYSPVGPDELQLSQGDTVEIQGLLLRGLGVFIGTHASTGRTGFVHRAHVKPLNTTPLDKRLFFLADEERASLAHVNPCSSEPSDSSLLERLFSSDISSVYRLDRLDETDFTYIQNRPKHDYKVLTSARQSMMSERSEGTSPFQFSPRPSVSHSSPSVSHRHSHNPLRLSFTLDDTFRELDEFQEDPPLFLEENSWEGEESELSDPTLTLLNQDHYQEDFLPLYDLHYSFLWLTFGGKPEDELSAHLESVRECSKRLGMHWAHRRACFVLGRLCARKLKFSQARVYFEEALSVCVDSFSDTPLLVALLTNLTAVYLKQRMKDKLPQTLEKASALLLCLPSHTFASKDEAELLKLLLRRSVVLGDKHLEARVCYLMSTLFLLLNKNDDALPFVERLQFLTLTLSAAEEGPVAPLDLNWLLSCLYHRKYMPYLALASVSLDSRQDHSLDDAFQKIELFIKNSVRLNPSWREGSSLLPAQIVVYLQQTLTIAELSDNTKTQRDLCMGLASIYQQYGTFDKAVRCAQQAVEIGSHMNEEDGFEASVLLGWLLVLTGQPEKAQSVLQPLLASLQSTDSPTQRGVIHNLLALSLRHQSRIKEAGRNFHAALVISRESGNQRNQALALANLGCLALVAGASLIAERFLVRSLCLFLELWESPTDEEHVQAYLWLGRSFKDRGRSQDIRACYEMGLLIALHARNLHSQMVVAKALSRLYADMLLYGQSIVYYEHCVLVSRELKDKRLEGEYLEILSSLYLSLNTEKSSRKSLDYTKQSLRISIDLGKREEESETWLQVGRIYYLIHEDELADMYLQAAVKTALRMNDAPFTMSIYEEAGDVYFKGHKNRMASVPFYRDGSLPFARSINDIHSEFRLLSKLTELLMSQGDQEEALQYATLAAQIANKTGVRVNERTAYHRLATIYYNLEHFEMAENYYLKSLSVCSPVLQHSKEARYYTKVYSRLGNLTLHKLKDAFDALGYFQLALAAALEDQANPEALYVVYMKLAEIHGNHLPDAQLCQVYRDRAQSLKKVLAGLGSSAAGEETVDEANAELGEEMKESLDDEFQEDLERNLTFECIPDNKHCELNSTLRPLTIPVDLKNKSAGMNLKEDSGQKLHSHFLPDMESPPASESDTIASQSFRDSILTESFDTAKEHISDSSSSTDVYQNPTEGTDSKFDSEHSTPSQIPFNHASDRTECVDGRDTDSDVPDEENTPVEETEASAALIQQEPDSVQEISLDDVGSCTEEHAMETCDTCSDYTNTTE
ncbi:SH3 domain and tetratricopeptide repeat-containing protein 2 isoform X2 [Oryzias melastigma]|uniref:SH3 domain and tetratricopeptide repeats 2 n=1 Tax=Oryzias melastigma TaxID=30732 RepID=A0A3B3BZL4_ORYME|nr:SH3 domain and tetratricopeptide repeat-containing protein 2 isoform X2 [Oryzias melastigma]XP_036069691.1 SH3 domain and tetratricopeptide repeat-containing protein 2 isoform X2 [Oryzias melastigma]XP_036069692.1 SH3 domain and tetratricopeptide repeat-containing protein 2 isoform X2 [Oryzias melastigma]